MLGMNWSQLKNYFNEQLTLPVLGIKINLWRRWDNSEKVAGDAAGSAKHFTGYLYETGKDEKPAQTKSERPTGTVQT